MEALMPSTNELSRHLLIVLDNQELCVRENPLGPTQLTSRADTLPRNDEQVEEAPLRSRKLTHVVHCVDNGVAKPRLALDGLVDVRQNRHAREVLGVLGCCFDEVCDKIGDFWQEGM